MSIHPSRAPLSLALALLFAAGCGESSEPSASPAPQPLAGPAIEPAAVAQDSGRELSVPAPAEPIADMEFVEDATEAVANRMIEFSDKLRRRDFRAAREWLADDFIGHPFAPLDEAERDVLALGVTRVTRSADTAPVVGPDAFLDGLREVIGPWNRMESVLWKVKAAEFEGGSPLWGRARFKTTILGDGPDGGPRSVVAWGHARVEKRKGRWLVVAYELESLTELSRSSFLMRDVATSTGLAHSGIRFGKPGNDSFAWNGAAAGDFDGDGLWDLFVPSRPRNFLYRGLAEGGFEDVAAARGLAEPGGGTGAVFFDFDADGDQDLAVGDVGWGGDGEPLGGNPLRLYVNDGKGSFVERGAELGFDARCNAYSLVVADFDSDGWPDVFVCNYGRVAAEPNNSWIDATNGMPNALLRNLAGKGFRDVAAEVGLVDTRWTYAAAAADADGDGDLDLYVANDYGPNSLWLNRGGRFEDIASEAGVTDLGNGMGAAWGDFDNDGSADLYVANMSSTAGNRILARLENQDDSWQDLRKMAAGNTIFRTRTTPGPEGTPGFELVPSSAGGVGASWAWSPALFDLDLDGRLDLYCCSGFVTGDTAADT